MRKYQTKEKKKIILRLRIIRKEEEKQTEEDNKINQKRRRKLYRKNNKVRQRTGDIRQQTTENQTKGKDYNGQKSRKVDRIEKSNQKVQQRRRILYKSKHYEDVGKTILQEYP